MRGLYTPPPGGGGATVPVVTTEADPVLTNEAVLGDDIIMRGTAGARPAASIAGRLYHASDTGVLSRDNGSGWDDIGTLTDHDHTAPGDGGILVGAKATYIDLVEGAAPGTPAAGHTRVYVTSDGDVKQKNEAGTESNLAATADPGSGAPDSAQYVVLATHPDLSAEAQLGAGVLMEGEYADLPAAAVAGRTYRPVDGLVDLRDDGALWVPRGPSFPLNGIADLPTTWNNRGASTITLSPHHAYLEVPASGYNDRRLVKTVPTLTYTIEICLLPNLVSVDQFCGFCWLLNSSGASANFGIRGDGALQAWKNSSPTGFSAYYGTPTPRIWTGPVWLRIGEDPTYRTCEFSQDGEHWTLYHYIARTDFITADRVGISVLNNYSQYRAGMTILSYREVP